MYNNRATSEVDTELFYFRIEVLFRTFFQQHLVNSLKMRIRDVLLYEN